MRRRVDARRENTISTSGRLFTRMREPCNGVNRVRQRPGSSVRNTPGTPPLMAIKLPENHARLSARCHIRSFPLTGSYEAVISERKRKSKIERGRRLSPPFPLYLLLPFLRFPADPSSPTDPFVLGCNPSAALAPAYRSGRLLSHDGNRRRQSWSYERGELTKAFYKTVSRFRCEAEIRMICGRAGSLFERLTRLVPSAILRRIIRCDPDVISITSIRVHWEFIRGKRLALFAKLNN